LFNPFSWLLGTIVSVLTKYPIVSTSFAALYLSSIWTLAWLFVFFLSTWWFDLSTSSQDFVNVFWLSIAAEAVIRWAENTNFIARLSKPYVKNAIGDNADYTFVVAGFLLFLSVTIMLFYDKFFERLGLSASDGSFIGQGIENGIEPLKNMIDNWMLTGSDNNVVTWLLLGTLFRAIIYKRNHRPPS